MVFRSLFKTLVHYLKKKRSFYIRCNGNDKYCQIPWDMHMQLIITFFLLLNLLMKKFKIYSCMFQQTDILLSVGKPKKFLNDHFVVFVFQNILYYSHKLFIGHFLQQKYKKKKKKKAQLLLYKFDLNFKDRYRQVKVQYINTK